MDLAVVGTGYVGLVTGTCFAELGHRVICVDNDRKKIANLNKQILPIYEPGLEELIRKNVKDKRLKFTVNLGYAVAQSTVLFIAVGTPPREDGSADLSYIENVAREIALNMREYKVVVEKSTVPVETGEWIERTLARNNRNRVDFDIVSNPEFLREGSAVEDFIHPDRIVVGVKTVRAEKIMRNLYQEIKAPVLVTDIKSAELIKHASNSFLATKISFINAVANLCDRVGADVTLVAQGMGLDKRIGPKFLTAGCGFGGFCFPKDLAAFIWLARKNGYEFNLLKGVEQINEEQKQVVIKKLEEAVWILQGKTIAVLGISFKPNTDDVRYAPALDIIRKLHQSGARVKAYDPVAGEKAKLILPQIVYGKNVYQTLTKADAAVICTEWDEFRNLDLARVKKIMNHPIIIDGRNIYDPAEMQKYGFIYKCIGRPV